MKTDPRITKLETELREAKEDLVVALAERDAYGRIWRHFEVICNKAGLWAGYDVPMPKSPRRPWKSILEGKEP